MTIPNNAKQYGRAFFAWNESAGGTSLVVGVDDNFAGVAPEVAEEFATALLDSIDTYRQAIKDNYAIQNAYEVARERGLHIPLDDLLAVLHAAGLAT